MIQGLIFDFDGLLVDTESPAYDSWLELYDEYGCAFPLEQWVTVLGGSGAEFDPGAYLAAYIDHPTEAAAFHARRWQRKLELVASQPLLPGVLDYLTAARQRGLGLAVASSSSRRWVADHVERLGILSAFDVIVTADNVTRVKPDPEIYRTALAALGMEPEQALAFEDAPNGLLAAKRAGLFTIAVPNPITCQLPLGHADLRLASLADMPLERLLVLVDERRAQAGDDAIRAAPVEPS